MDSASAKDIVTAAFRISGVVGQGQALAGNLLATGYDRLQAMMGRWAAKRLTIFQTVRQVVPLTTAASYTIGTGGTINVPRPLWIAGAGLLYTDVTPTLEVPIDVLDDDQYADVRLKTLTAAVPGSVFYDRGLTSTTSGLSRVYPLPIPNGTRTLSLVLYLPTPLGQFADQNTVYLLPDGYLEALEYQLALRLGPEFGKTLDQDTKDIAKGALADLQRVNNRPGLLKADSGLPRQRGGFNWQTGSFGRGGRS